MKQIVTWLQAGKRFIISDEVKAPVNPPPWAKSETAYRRDLPVALRWWGQLCHSAVPADLWWPCETRLFPCSEESCSSQMGLLRTDEPRDDSCAESGRWCAQGFVRFSTLLWKMYTHITNNYSVNTAGACQLTPYRWRRRCRRSVRAADLLHTWGSLTRSPGGRRSPEPAVCSAPSRGLCWAGRPPGRCGARPSVVGGRCWRSGCRLTPLAPLPGRPSDKAAPGRGDEPPAVWAEGR